MSDIPQLVLDIFGDAARRDFHGYEEAVRLNIRGQLVCYVGMTVRTILVNSESLKIAGVGFVCTHPDWRRLGLMRATMDIVHERTRRLELPFALLNTGMPYLYTPMGYRHPPNLSEEWMVASFLDEWDDTAEVDLCGSW